MNIEIRQERTADESAIHALTTSAFEPMPYSDGSEAKIIDQLRENGDLTVSLVALRGGELVGHVAFSPVRIGQDATDWFGLGPLSVEPTLQKQGIGTRLVRSGLDVIRQMGAKGCVLVGDPDYYCRFGFQSDGHATYENVPDPYVQWLSFGSHKAVGAIQYASAFTA